jgi:hypothetical protein
MTQHDTKYGHKSGESFVPSNNAVVNVESNTISTNNNVFVNAYPNNVFANIHVQTRRDTTDLPDYGEAGHPDANYVQTRRDLPNYNEAGHPDANIQTRHDIIENESGHPDARIVNKEKK